MISIFSVKHSFFLRMKVLNIFLGLLGMALGRQPLRDSRARVSNRLIQTLPTWSPQEPPQSLEDEEMHTSTKLIKEQIAQINQRLSDQDKETLIMEASQDNPPGYDCTNEVMEIKEVSFTDQIRCYNTTEEICSQTHITIFESRTEKQCDTHFKKVCW